MKQFKSQELTVNVSFAVAVPSTSYRMVSPDTLSRISSDRLIPREDESLADSSKSEILGESVSGSLHPFWVTYLTSSETPPGD
jgi:hypothetical protein